LGFKLLYGWIFYFVIAFQWGNQSWPHNRTQFKFGFF
jgi:hypothetical protein